MNCPISFYDKSHTRIEEIDHKIELAAVEFAFNLEVTEFNDVLVLQGISEEDYEQYFNELSEFLSFSTYRYSNSSVFNRAWNAHKLMSDSFIYKHNGQQKLIGDCFEWLMP